MEERRGAYKVLVGKAKGKRPLGRPRVRWEDNNVVKVKVKVKFTLEHATKGQRGIRVITLFFP